MKHIHSQLSPFPYIMPKSGRAVRDEKCACGHVRSDHFDTLAYGHGPCGFSPNGQLPNGLAIDATGKAPICDCGKYTWAGFLP